MPVIGGDGAMRRILIAAILLAQLLASCSKRRPSENPIPESARLKARDFPEWRGRRIFPCECNAETPGKDGRMVTVTTSARLCQPMHCSLEGVCQELERRTGARCRGVSQPTPVEYSFDAVACGTTEIFPCEKQGSTEAGSTPKAIRK